MFEEVIGLTKTHTWDLVDLPLEKKLWWGASGSIRLRQNLMGLLSDTRHVLWLRGSIKSMSLIVRRRLRQWLNLPLSDLSFQLPMCVVGIFLDGCEKCTYKMVILVNKFICILLLDTLILHTKFTSFDVRCMD